MCFLLFAVNDLAGQPTFSIKYHIKLINEYGNVLTCDSLAKDSIFVDSHPGYLVKHEYEAVSKSFCIEINTIVPEFALIWKRKNAQMIFSIDCPTEYKEIYLDSLFFDHGRFLVHDNCEKYIVSQNSQSRHLIFSDYVSFKQNSDFFPERKDLINIINCR